MPLTPTERTREWRRLHPGYAKEYWRNTTPEQRQRSDELRRKRLAIKRGVINSLKQAPCTDCKGIFPAISMDFDHIAGSVKVASVATLKNRSGSLEQILAEIAKCELVCSNCHRIRTEARRVMPAIDAQFPDEPVE